ncbi:uncharacterized protein LOC130736863 [Lotus japonicus]|uniref:uncharacterized protein LOC130736863 n=1 Tax=Lotus japonicus TaxID=34305 RepID=UPI0025887E62|nr:uncharacterized protein LOC130736863 [Lotus japonicus]
MWNVDLIDHVFSPATAACILVGSLPIHGCCDLLFWPETQDGWYTSKSGYEFIRRLHAQEEASSSSAPVIPAAFWRLIWRSSAIPQCRELVWQACSSFLPVRGGLRMRGIDVDPACPWCRVDNETISHVLLLCPMIEHLWFAAMGLRVARTGEFHELLSQIVHGLEADVVARIFTLLYAIWEARNAWVFENRELQVAHVIQRMDALRAFP